MSRIITTEDAKALSTISTSCNIKHEASPLILSKQSSNWYQWRVDVDARRTLSFDSLGSTRLTTSRLLRTSQPPEIPLLIKIHRKRGMGWLIALDEPIFNKPVKTNKSTDLIPSYDYII